MSKPRIFAMAPVDAVDLPTFEGLPIPDVVPPESVRRTCPCGRECWMGPDQVAEYVAGLDMALCYVCVTVIARNIVANGGDIEIGPPGE